MTESKINELIHERDENRCVICKRWVDPGEKYHHVIFRSHCGKSTVENGVTLCRDCHRDVHQGKNSKEVRRKCEEYLILLYGGVKRG